MPTQNTQIFTNVSSHNFLQHCFSFHFHFPVFPPFPIISTFVLRHLLCPSTQHTFSIHPSFTTIPFYSIPCMFPTASSGSFLFYFYISYKVTCLQAVFFLPYLYFISAPSVRIYVIHALHFVKVISYCVDPVTALKITNLFSCTTVYLLITLLETMREFL